MTDRYEGIPVESRCKPRGFWLSHKWGPWRYQGEQRGGDRYISDCRWCGQRRSNIVFPSTPETLRHTLLTAPNLHDGVD